MIPLPVLQKHNGNAEGDAQHDGARARQHCTGGLRDDYSELGGFQRLAAIKSSATGTPTGIADFGFPGMPVIRELRLLPMYDDGVCQWWSVFCLSQYY